MRRAFLIVVLVVVSTTACANGAGMTSGPAAPTASDREGAPTIASPRALAPRATDPCRSLLSNDQLQALGFEPPGTARSDALGSPTCSWRSARGGGLLEATVVTDGAEDLFVQTYRRPPTGRFEAHEVAGLPAVDTQFVRGSPACTTTVGVADFQSLAVNIARGVPRSGERESDACAISRRVAEEIVSTLPPLPR